MKQHHLFILDGSGSMSGMEENAVNALNEYITMVRTASKEEGVDTYFSLLLFSDREAGDQKFRYVYDNEDISQIKDWKKKDYKPYNSTPLFDAVGKGINELLKKIDMADRSMKVFVSIFTDGFENASIKFDKAKISKMISFFNEDKRFDINFLGCGGFQEIQEYATSFGVKAQNVMNYTGKEDHGRTMKGYSTSIVSKMKMK